jgi:hypothetical protein
MTAERRTTLAALQEFEAACATTRRELRQHETMVQRVRRQLERDEPFTSVIARNRVASSRVNLTSAITELERARAQMRMACFRLGHEEGVTIAELGRLWGFSRQLASRISKDARGARNGRRPAAAPADCYDG